MIRGMNNMEKMRMETKDLTEDNIKRLAKLFPEALTEAEEPDTKTVKKVIDFDVLKQLLSNNVVEGVSERYNFTWPGKKEAIIEANRPIKKTLRPCVEESKNWSETENIYIEGDNLEALKLIQESYLGAVKLIYIDPPYNTGKDFVYRDNYARSTIEFGESEGSVDDEGNKLFLNSENNGRFHSDWCSMIYPRLMLAKNLLSDDGVIIINIDENEVTNLQKICVEIFGESNDLGTIIWDKRNPKGDAKGISSQHEYILVYSKNKNVLSEVCKIQRPKKNAELMLKKAASLMKKVGIDYTLSDANKEYADWISSLNDISGGERAYNKIDSNGDIYRLVSMAWPNKKKAPDDYFIPLIHPETKKPCVLPERGWRNPSQTMNELMKKGLIIFGKDESTQPTRKYLLKENMYENVPSLLYYGGSDVDLLSELKIPFETPKVVDICKEHILSFTKDNDIIMDFFSGSSTVAHAVMEINAEVKGKRKYIMIQLCEKCKEGSEANKAGFDNICEIGIERIIRSGKKICIEHGLDKSSIDFGFRVFKVDETNMKDVYYAPQEYKQILVDGTIDNIKSDRSDLDLLFGIILDWGLELSLPIEKIKIDSSTVYLVDSKSLVASFDSNISESTIREIAKMKPTFAVFRDSSFSGSQSKINLEEIFKSESPETVVKVI